MLDTLKLTKKRSYKTSKYQKRHKTKQTSNNIRNAVLERSDFSGITVQVYQVICGPAAHKKHLSANLKLPKL